MLFGISSILEQTTAIFYVLKFAGAVYLIYLGIKQWRVGKPEVNIENSMSSPVSRRAFLDGFVVCGINPKAILYYAALLPQFVVQAIDERFQMIILAITSLVIALVILVVYTLLADRVRDWFHTNEFWKVQNRIAGVLMIGAGIVLSLVTR
jgi:homoserine/homoserine lactone efflux protein